jgi:hypothetical protein
MALTEPEAVITVLKRDAGGGIASYRYSGHHSQAACEKVYDHSVQHIYEFIIQTARNNILNLYRAEKYT